MRALSPWLLGCLLLACDSDATAPFVDGGVDGGADGGADGGSNGRPSVDQGQDAALGSDGALPSDAAFTADAGSDGAAPLPAGDHEFEIETPDGRTRRYLLHVPPQLSDPPPLLLAFHGGGGSAEGTVTTTGLSATADSHGFVVAYPEGVPALDGGGTSGPSATWNTGACCGRALQEDVDDVAYVSALLDDLAERMPYDQKRVYGTGISNGSMMSYRVACELSERIAAIAPVAGQADGFECAPSRPLSVMHIHGTEDSCAIYEGGPACGGCFQRFLNEWLGTMIDEVTWPCGSVNDYVAEWRDRNDCGAESAVTYEEGDARCDTWSCAAGTEVSLCVVTGMGHTWPDGQRPALCDAPNSRACKAWINHVGSLTTDIGNDQIWAFLERHALP